MLKLLLRFRGHPRREAVLAFLGEQVNKLRSFSVASGSSFLIAACSCTVIPVASGLYYAGAGVGAAFIVLWVAPAANVLALTYTGTILGLVGVFVVGIIGFLLPEVWIREWLGGNGLVVTFLATLLGGVSYFAHHDRGPLRAYANGERHGAWPGFGAAVNRSRT